MPPQIISENHLTGVHEKSLKHVPRKCLREDRGLLIATRL